MNKNSKFVRKLCMIGLLTAVTVILAVFCTFRIGSMIKIPFKFLSIFLISAVFGGVWGGISALIGDFFNVFITGMAFNPFISAVEFLYGVIFGLLFYKHSFIGKGYILRAVICSVIMFLIDIFITSYILTFFGIFADFYLAVSCRLPAGIIKAVLQLTAMIFGRKFLIYFKRLVEK